MIERINRQKTIRNSIGRGKWQSDLVPNPEADLKLFEALRLDKDGVKPSPVPRGHPQVHRRRRALQRSRRRRVCDHAAHALRRPPTPCVSRSRTRCSSTANEFRLHRLAPRPRGAGLARRRRGEAVRPGVQVGQGHAAGDDVPAHPTSSPSRRAAQAVAELDPQIELGPVSKAERVALAAAAPVAGLLRAAPLRDALRRRSRSGSVPGVVDGQVHPLLPRCAGAQRVGSGPPPRLR